MYTVCIQYVSGVISPRRYQHSRHLVKALNRFADQEADLSSEWEKKLNQQGKVFIILCTYSEVVYDTFLVN